MKTSTSRLSVTVENGNTIKIGNHFSCSFQRTLRIPDDNKTYNLPPSLGTFPVKRVDDYPNTVPPKWKKHGGVFIPMYQCEAMWIKFNGNYNSPNAVKVAVGMVNAISGKPWSEQLSTMENDYLVVPNQLWLDGINAGDGTIRQFVAMPLGSGVTVEGQVTGKEEFGGVQLLVYESKPRPQQQQQQQSFISFFDQVASISGFSAPAAPPAGRAPMAIGSSNRELLSPRMKCVSNDMLFASPPSSSAPASAEMGLAAGGKMQQKIYKDTYGIDNWDQSSCGRVYIHIVNSLMYQQITGEKLPPTPITQAVYKQYNFPWYQIYDEHKDHIAPSPILSNVQSVGTLLGNNDLNNVPPVNTTTINKLDQPVEINVGGVTYTTTPRTLTSFNNCRLAAYFDASTGERAASVPLTHDQKVFIDRDGEVFKYVLNYLRSQGSADSLPDDLELLKRLSVEAQFYQLSSLQSYCTQKIQQQRQALLPSSPSSGMKLIKLRANNSNSMLCSANPPHMPQQKKVIPYSDVSFTLTSPKNILVKWFIGDSAGNHIVDINGVEQGPAIGSSGFALASANAAQYSYGLMANLTFFKHRLQPGNYVIKLKWTPYENSQYIVNGPIITEAYEIDDGLVEVDAGHAFVF